MNNDVESLLHEGMERFTKDLRAPAGLIRHATQRRRRRLALRSVAGSAAVLAAGAVALIAVVVPGVAENPAVASASVVKRIDKALSAAEPGEIAQVTVTTRAATGPGAATRTITAEEWSYGDQWRSVSYSSAGHLLYAEGSSTSSVYTLVSYPTRTWARQRDLGSPAGLGQHKKPVVGEHPVRNRTVHPGGRILGPHGCKPTGGAVRLLLQPGLPGIGFSASAPPTTAAKALRSAISCGIFAVAGRDRVDGNEAIELTSSPGSPFTETIWVRPGTDLPIRVVVRSAPGQPAFRMTADISWLAPTPQNLAKLTVPIPAGFRRVPLAEAIGLTVLHLQGPLPKRICLPADAGTTCQY